MSPVGRFGGGSRLANSSRTALAEWSGSLGAIYWHFSPSTVQTDHSAAATNSLVKTAVYGLSGMLSSRKSPICYKEFPNVIPCPFWSGPDLRGLPESKPMKIPPPPPTAGPATLQTVLDRLAGNAGLPDSRRRDLRSAILSFAKLRGQPPAAIPLNLAEIRADPQPQGPDAARYRASDGQTCAATLPAPSMPPACFRCSGPPTLRSTQSGPACLRPPTIVSAMAFRVSLDGQACAVSRRSPSTPARSTASSRNWMPRP